MKKKRDEWPHPIGCVARKIILTMKLTFVLLLLSVLQLTASVYSQNSKLSLDLQNRTVKEVLQKIEEQSEFRFFYNEQFVDLNRKVSVSIENKKVEYVLSQVFAGTRISYKIMENNLVVITPTDGQQPASKIRGRVTDTSGIELPGVAVMIKGTTNGTVTGADGTYSFSEVPKDAVLVFSFMGMKTQEVLVAGQPQIDVKLIEDAIGIEEVVAVGYGVQKKANLSGAVNTVEAKELQSRPITSLSQGLQGVSPNLNIDFISGEPGQTAQLNIRGVTSINGGDPLILIDGVPSSSWELNRLTPEDVSDISVLKDAAAAAIYGARAAFGVVLITTKSGRKEGIYASYNGNLTWSKPSVLPEKVTDPYVYMRLQEISTNNTPWDYINYTDEMYQWARERSDNPEGTEGVRLNPEKPTEWQYMGNRDWTQYFLSDYTFSQKHNMQIDGKTDKTSYYLSAAFDDERGALKIAEDYFSRYNLRSKVNYSPFSWLTVGNNTSYSMTERRKPSNLSIWTLYNFAPTSYDKNPDGTWANSDVGWTAANLKEGGKHSDKNNTLQTTFTAEANLFNKTMKLNADYTARRGDQNYNWNTTKYMIGYGPEDVREVGNNRAWRRAGFDTYNAFNVFATYDKVFAESHHVTTLIGFNQESSRWESFDGERGDVITGSLPSLSLATGEQIVSESITTWAVRGYFYRLGYIFKDRYIFELNGRYDGSSRFPKEKRYGFFPSASVAWRLDQEKFFDPIKHVVSNLKFRASFGSLGNQNVSAYGYIPSMSAYELGYIVDGKRPQYMSVPALVSDNYSWETVKTFNAGFDIGFFDDKLSGVFDIYCRNTTGMLTMGKALPAVLGASVPNENAADLQTNGWELTLSYRDKFMLAGKPMHFDTRFILSDSRAWITKFDNPNLNMSQYYKGYEFGEMWGMESDGLYQSEEEIGAMDMTKVIPWGALNVVPGWPKFKDLDGNGIIERGNTIDDPKDLKIIGNTSARFRYGLNLNFEWNGFDIKAFFQGIGKRDYYPRHYLFWGFYQQPYAGGYKHLLDFYRENDDSEALIAQHSKAYLEMGLHKANHNAEFPVLQSWLADVNVGTTGLGQPQTGWLKSAAYLRLKNLTVGYTIPKHLTQRMKIDRIRFFISGENLYEWSELRKYLDPEAITDNGYGYQYPFMRKYSVGVNINF